MSLCVLLVDHPYPTYLDEQELPSDRDYTQRQQHRKNSINNKTGSIIMFDFRCVQSDTNLVFVHHLSYTLGLIGIHEEVFR